MIAIGFFGAIWAAILAIWNLFLFWLSIFAAPVKLPEMFWFIIPVWVNWFFTEFFQEKYGTSFGNAVSNGVIAIFAGVDWTRYMYRLLSDGVIKFTFGIFLKFSFAIAAFLFGIFVIIAGIRIKQIVFFIGRIRWVTYILLMFTPIVYGVIKANFYTLSAIILFFPLYYWVIEYFDRITPEPRVYRES